MPQRGPPMGPIVPLGPLRLLHLICLIGIGLSSGCAQTRPIVPAVAPVQDATSAAESIALGEEMFAAAHQMCGGQARGEARLAEALAALGRDLVARSDARGLAFELALLNTSRPEAWILPAGKLGVSRGLLLALEDEAQVAALLAHLIAHAAADRGFAALDPRLFVADETRVAAICASASDHAELIVGTEARAGALVRWRFSDESEEAALRASVRLLAALGYDPHATVELQHKLISLTTSPLVSDTALLSAHAPSSERIEWLSDEIERLERTGKPGRRRRFRDRYRDRIASLHESRDAYDAYDLARRVLAEGDLETAAEEIAHALERQPEEALFHGLAGDVLLAQQRADEAEATYSRAIELDPDYFEYPLHRGLARLELADDARRAGARDDFQRSLELLPTLTARHALARVAEEAGDLALAIEQYRRIASTASRRSREARHALARLELSLHPGDYVDVATALDRWGFVTIQIENRAPIAVHRIEIEVQRRLGDRLRKSTIIVNDTIPASARHSRRTNIGPFAHEAELAQVKLSLLTVEPYEELGEAH